LERGICEEVDCRYSCYVERVASLGVRSPRCYQTVTKKLSAGLYASAECSVARGEFKDSRAFVPHVLLVPVDIQSAIISTTTTTDRVSPTRQQTKLKPLTPTTPYRKCPPRTKTKTDDSSSPCYSSSIDHAIKEKRLISQVRDSVLFYPL